MTPTERSTLLQLVGQLLIDNSGNRITRALAIGICTEIEQQTPVEEPPKPQEPAP